MAADANSSEADVNAADDERNRLLFELAGTSTGQRQLAARIEKTTDLEERGELERYQRKAREAHLAKLEELRRAKRDAAPSEPVERAAVVTSATAYSSKGGKGAPATVSSTHAVRADIAAEVAAEAALRDEMARESESEMPGPTQPLQGEVSTLPSGVQVHRPRLRPTHNQNGDPICYFCSAPAVTYEALLRSTGGEFPRQYRCNNHRRDTLAPNTVSGNITDADRLVVRQVTATAYRGKGK